MAEVLVVASLDIVDDQKQKTGSVKVSRMVLRKFPTLYNIYSGVTSHPAS